MVVATTELDRGVEVVTEELDWLEVRSSTLDDILGVGVGVALVTMVTSTQADSPTPFAGSKKRTAEPTDWGPERGRNGSWNMDIGPGDRGPCLVDRSPEAQDSGDDLEQPSLELPMMGSCAQSSGSPDIPPLHCLRLQLYTPVSLLLLCWPGATVDTGVGVSVVSGTRRRTGEDERRGNGEVARTTDDVSYGKRSEGESEEGVGEGVNVVAIRGVVVGVASREVLIGVGVKTSMSAEMLVSTVMIVCENGSLARWLNTTIPEKPSISRSALISMMSSSYWRRPHPLIEPFVLLTTSERPTTLSSPVRGRKGSK
jgi:hypothetical protein